MATGLFQKPHLLSNDFTGTHFIKEGEYKSFLDLNKNYKSKIIFGMVFKHV